jgi:hypothetical protein
MKKARLLLKKIGLFRSKAAAEEEACLFDKRLKKVTRAREYNATKHGPAFKNPQSQPKA